MLGRWLVVVSCAVLTACASVNSALHRDPTAIAMLAPTEGYTASGAVQFRQNGDVMQINIRIDGLEPNAVHGLHIHEIGDCRASDASSAGGHFDPQGNKHGGPQDNLRHAGDLGNVNSDADGTAQTEIEVGGISLGTGPDSIIGRSVIVTAQADDLVSQPSGNAGARIACGLISKNPDKFF
jgi:superoxide dismutase, Cu-Zn family